MAEPVTIRHLCVHSTPCRPLHYLPHMVRIQGLKPCLNAPKALVLVSTLYPDGTGSENRTHVDGMKVHCLNHLAIPALFSPGVSVTELTLSRLLLWNQNLLNFYSLNLINQSITIFFKKLHNIKDFFTKTSDCINIFFRELKRTITF